MLFTWLNDKDLTLNQPGLALVISAFAKASNALLGQLASRDFEDGNLALGQESAAVD